MKKTLGCESRALYEPEIPVYLYIFGTSDRWSPYSLSPFEFSGIYM